MTLVCAVKETRQLPAAVVSSLPQKGSLLSESVPQQLGQVSVCLLQAVGTGLAYSQGPRSRITAPMGNAY